MKSKNKIFLAFKVLCLAIAILLVALGAALAFSSCSFFESLDDNPALSASSSTVKVTGLSLAKNSLDMKVGSIDYIGVKAEPKEHQKNFKLHWTYDASIIKCDTDSSFGVAITGLKEGQTYLRCSCGGYDAACIVTVAGYEQGYEANVEPYIYSNSSILQTSPGVTEKVFVSLYGGNASDIDGYTWTIDNSSVAAIEPTGQYCLISAKSNGYARIKVTHAKATYPYYIGVYVFDDITNVTYITTGNNILTMNKDSGEQTISVSLVNGKDTSFDSQFEWQILNSDSSEVPVRIEKNGSKCVVTPKNSGSCTIRVTHPDAAYPLDILCRVITIVQNVYIKPDNPIVRLEGENEQTVTCSLENIKEGDYSIDDYEYALDNLSAAEIVSYVGNQVILKGKANGSAKLIIRHSKAAYPREVLLIVTGQLTDAVDASHYITTSQNYIRTKVGADPTKILISLKGGEEGDENNFEWSVCSTPKEGVGDVAKLETTNGHINQLLSFQAAPTFIDGNAMLTPLEEGTAVITMTHPKVVYPTEILVKVLNKDAILESPLYFVGDGLLRIVNGQSQDYEVQLKGTNKRPSDDASIMWSVEDNRLSVNASQNLAHVTAPTLGTGRTISHLYAKHNKADADKNVLVLTADSEEDLLKMKAFYADKLYYNFEVGSTAYITCEQVGFEDGYDFSRFKWTLSDSSVVSIEKSDSLPLSCKVTGLKSGTVKLTGSLEDEGETYSCEFTLTVYPVGAMATDPEVYLTTAQNVVTIGEIGKSTTVTVTAVNLNPSKYSAIKWNCSNADVAVVAPNGNKATITAAKEGESVITVTHPDSQNELKIYVRVGNEYAIPDAAPVVYIAAQDVITMLRDDPIQKLQAALANYQGTVKTGFSFEIDNEDVAKISSQSSDGIAFVKPVASGQAQITIRHTATDIDKKVLVVVGNSAEELAGYTYLTTSSNVVVVGEGNTKNVSVQIKNAESIVIDGYTWESNKPAAVNVTAAGATATLHGNSIGTAIITVRNPACKYPLEIIAQCVDPIAAGESPFIQLTSSVMTVTVGSAYNTVSAELVGGEESDKSGFTWTTNDSNIAAVYGQNEVGKIKAVSAGTTYINVSHPKAIYPAQLLVVCDEVKTGNCSISVPSSIINMKPSDSSQTITANLINGDENDKYNFNWSLDVYDIIDFDYSANICQITPKQAGSVTITISHPKAAYDQQIRVNVQQYSSFKFPYESMTMTQGDVKFITMEVPATNVATHVEYSVENGAICSITGTKTTAQLTAVGNGTTTVKARLIATSSGVEQAKAEMMVYVKEKEVGSVYITANDTISTINKGKSQSLSATLVGAGVTSSDQQNLKWSTADSDIVQIAGVKADGTVIGQSVYITALKPGEAVITCSHEKAASNLQFYVVVPGAAEKIITLNKNYITIVKGKNGTELKANIENAESNADYYNIIWSVENVGEREVCRIMGSGQNVTIYPLNVGSATVRAQLPDSSVTAVCDIIVTANKSFAFETTTLSVLPKHTRKLKYTVSPPNTTLRWGYVQTEDYFTYRDLGADEDGVGYVEIEGLDAQGTGTITCVTAENAKATCSVRVGWNYAFSLTGKTVFNITPEETAEVTYSVSPYDSEITIESTELDKSFKYTVEDLGEGRGVVKILPIGESGKNDFSIRIRATNPNMGNEEVGCKDVKARITYKDVTPVLTFIRTNGKFSRYEPDAATLFIGDGETVTMNVGVKEENANATITAVKFIPKTTSGGEPRNMLISNVENSGNGKLFSLTNAEDILDIDWVIDKVIAPKNVNWRDSYIWRVICTVDDGNVCGYRGQWGITATDFLYFLGKAQDNHGYYEDVSGYVEDVSARGMRLSEHDFKDCAWLYCPGTPSGQFDLYDGYGITYDSFEKNLFPRGRLKAIRFNGDLLEYVQYEDLYSIKMGEKVMENHVQYHTAPSLDETVLSSSGNKGTIQITVNHCGSSTTKTFNVYSEERACNILAN